MNKINPCPHCGAPLEGCYNPDTSYREPKPFEIGICPLCAGAIAHLPHEGKIHCVRLTPELARKMLPPDKIEGLRQAQLIVAKRRLKPITRH
jgi:hypothetical protein